MICFTTETGQGGGFALERVPAGKYRIQLSGGGLDRSVLRDVEIGGGSSDFLTVVVGVPTLRGTVSDQATGLPIVGAKVRLVGRRWVSTDAAGTWRLLDLWLPETSSLEFSKDGYVGKTLPRVKVVPGEPRRVDVELAPERR